MDRFLASAQEEWEKSLVEYDQVNDNNGTSICLKYVMNNTNIYVPNYSPVLDVQIRGKTFLILIFGILVMLLIIIGLCIFSCLQRKYLYLKSRSLLLVTLSGASIFINAILMLKSELRGKHTVYCHAYVAIVYTVFAIQAGAISASMFLFVHKLLIAKRILKKINHAAYKHAKHINDPNSKTKREMITAMTSLIGGGRRSELTKLSNNNNANARGINTSNLSVDLAHPEIVTLNSSSSTTNNPSTAKILTTNSNSSASLPHKRNVSISDFASDGFLIADFTSGYSHHTSRTSDLSQISGSSNQDSLSPLGSKNNAPSKKSRKRDISLCDGLRASMSQLFNKFKGNEFETGVKRKVKTRSNNNNQNENSSNNANPVNPATVAQSDLASVTTGTSSISFGRIAWLLNEIVIPLVLLAIFYIPFLIAMLVRIMTSPPHAQHCYGCRLELGDMIAVVVSAFVIGIALLIIIYSVRNEPDPLKVKKEVGICIMFLLIGVIAWPLEYVDPGRISMYYKFTFQVVWVFCIFMVFWTMTYYQIIRSVVKRKNNKTLPIDTETLLGNAETRYILLEYAVNELSAENILFLLAVKKWKIEYPTRAPEAALESARAIIFSFVDQHADYQINLPESIREPLVRFLPSTRKESVHSPYTSEIGGISVTSVDIALFDAAYAEVEQLVTLDTLPRFFESSIYKNKIESQPALQDLLHLEKKALG